MPIFPVPGLGDGLLGLVLAFLITVALVPLAIRLAWRVGAIDRPGGNKIHARVTPLMGGVAIALSFLAVAILLPSLHPHGYNRGLVGLLAGCAMATLIGVADEIWSLRPRWHFLGQVACVV
ncbi:MAG TPA: hypothetical protein VHB98_05155, partial [Chloroflexota bacterium]|nr:hypothetical protein [Chloroflexota bacterium]